jgi:hypothetical protein
MWSAKQTHILETFYMTCAHMHPREEEDFIPRLLDYGFVAQNFIDLVWVSNFTSLAKSLVTTGMQRTWTIDNAQEILGNLSPGETSRL